MADKKYSPVFLDISKMAINTTERLLGVWEEFIGVTGEVPDSIVASERQINWWTNQMLEKAKKYGWNIKIKALDEPSFKGAPLIARKEKKEC